MGIAKAIKSLFYIKSGKVDRIYSGSIVDTGDVELSVRRLHAKQFLKLGFIAKDQLNDQGVMNAQTDLHHNESTYFCVKDTQNNVVAGARFIMSNSSVLDLQAIKNTKLTDNEKTYIGGLNSSEVAELSGLAKEDGVSQLAVLKIYKTMWLFSDQHKIRYWIMTVNEGFEGRLTKLFGKSMKKLGSQEIYMNTKVQPYIIDLEVSSRQKHKGYSKLIIDYITQ